MVTLTSEKFGSSPPRRAYSYVPPPCKFEKSLGPKTKTKFGSNSKKDENV